MKCTFEHVKKGLIDNKIFKEVCEGLDELMIFSKQKQISDLNVLSNLRILSKY